MPVTLEKSEIKFIKEILIFYNKKFYDLDNQHINLYLMLKRTYPGTNAYKLIRNFFNRNLRQNRAVFFLLEQRFQNFLKTIYEFYYFLLSKDIDGIKIIKLRHLLIDFYCWLLLNDIHSFKDVSYTIYQDFISSKNFQDFHTDSDVHILGKALEYYQSMKGNEPFIPLKKVKKIDEDSGKFDQKIDFKSLEGLIFDPAVKSVFYLSFLTGLHLKEILNIKNDDVDMYHQILEYSGQYSARRLKIVFPQKVKNLLIENMNFKVNDVYLFYDGINSSNDERWMYFQNRLEFELKNARMEKCLITAYLRKTNSPLYF